MLNWNGNRKNDDSDRAFEVFMIDKMIKEVENNDDDYQDEPEDGLRTAPHVLHLGLGLRTRLLLLRTLSGTLHQLLKIHAVLDIERVEVDGPPRARLCGSHVAKSGMTHGGVVVPLP